MTNNDKERINFIKELQEKSSDKEELQYLLGLLLELREDLEKREVNSKKMVKQKIEEELVKRNVMRLR